MLTKKEEKLIKRYNVLPRIGIAAMGISLVSVPVWFVFSLIDNLVYKNRMVWSFGVYVEIGVAIGYCVIMAYGFMVPIFGMRRKKWRLLETRLEVKQDERDFSREIARSVGMTALGNLGVSYGKKSGNKTLQRSGYIMKIAGGVATTATAYSMASNAEERASRVAKAYGVEVPKTKNLIIVLAIIPLIMLVSAYVPHYMEQGVKRQAEIEIISGTINRLREAFTNGSCGYVSFDDPSEVYMEYTYGVSGYIGEAGEMLNSYVNVNINRSGVVVDVSYSLDIDVTKDKEETKQQLENELAFLNGLFDDVDVEVASDELLTMDEIPDAFWDEFMNASYYEDVYIRDKGEGNTAYSVSYNTESKEEFNDYSRPYIYFSIFCEES